EQVQRTAGRIGIGEGYAADDRTVRCENRVERIRELGGEREIPQELVLLLLTMRIEGVIAPVSASERAVEADGDLVGLAIVVVHGEREVAGSAAHRERGFSGRGERVPDRLRQERVVRGEGELADAEIGPVRA